MQVIKTRRSIRQYQDKPIPKEALQNLVDAARFAATARNIQPWEFIVITKPDTLKTIAGLVENARFLAQAKACIVVFSSDTKYYLEDGCAATVNIMLAATAMGIGSCWVAGDKKPYCVSVAKLLDVPDTLKLVSLVSLGYPVEESSFCIVEKRSLREIIHWEKF
jgi:nitroreductase